MIEQVGAGNNGEGNMETIRSYRCPKKSGGCGRDAEWIVAITDDADPALICECHGCGYRMEFPLSHSKLGHWTGQVDLTGRGIRKWH